ncbi:ABC transporter ATP-binding protein [Xanthobacter sp. KR7-65]|uniref:ABC transporter ATP-binding protein n=1 Tax=Xanthobacter sp. KR7-65 TaxID=3156612 RepID=UPI0032B5C0C3
MPLHSDMATAHGRDLPRPASEDAGRAGRPIIAVRALRKHFPIAGGLLGRPQAWVQAVDGIDFAVAPGETLSIVGESGCGKSTTARLLMHLIVPDSGQVEFEGEVIGERQGISVRDVRRRMQMVFQDSHASLNPRLTIEDSIAFGQRAAGVADAAAKAQARRSLDMVGLTPSMFAQRYPHELSGGQRQRVNIARALALEPRLLILDESVSALDKSLEAQILNLLEDLKTSLNLTYIFISHDLSVVQYISDRVLVMYLGKIVEIAPVADIYGAPSHPYTQALLASRPTQNPRLRRSAPPLTGDPPNPISPPSGCRFRTRCPLAKRICAEREPSLAPAVSHGGHLVACHARHGGSNYEASAA